MTETTHTDLAHKYGKESVTKSWNDEYTMRIIHALMSQYPYELSEEIQSAFAQGIKKAAKQLNNQEKK